MDYQIGKNRQKFYNSSEWRMLRNFLLSRQPLCDICLTKDRVKPATECHHKIDIKDEPSRRLDTNNIQTLCKECHSSITANTNNDNDFKPVGNKWSLDEQLQKLNKKK